MISPLLTDLYQLTMAYGYWKLNMHEREAVFHHIYRTIPFQGHYLIVCGLETVINFLKNWEFKNDDIEYLAQLTSPDGAPLFEAAFLRYLKELRFSCDIDAIPEGTLVFPHEPLLRVTGPLLQAQLIESTLLNLMNFQSLIATKASRVCLAAQGEPVLEFGMRRAQGADGALSASRAAYIGGCASTSNVLAGKLYGIPVRGTHAHSWVTSFPDEISAFSAYANAMPRNCVLLVDTYHSINGVKNAIKVGKKLREQGGELMGVRLDSGNMTQLSIQARKLLDKEGFENTDIIASNSLDEYCIEKMKKEGAKINIWGVGTNLVTSYDQPALDGVYKLAALKDETGNWEYKLKLSEELIKISTPGICQVRRFFQNDGNQIDVMYDLKFGISETPEIVSFSDSRKKITLGDYDGFVDLLEPIFRRGKCVYPDLKIQEIREFSMQQVRDFVATQSQPYVVGIEKNMADFKEALIGKMLSSHGGKVSE